VEIDQERHQVRYFSREPVYPEVPEEQEAPLEPAAEVAEAQAGAPEQQPSEGGVATAVSEPPPPLADEQPDMPAPVDEIRVVQEDTEVLEEEAAEQAEEEIPELEPIDYIEEEITPSDFGRIAAQTAKQVVLQRIREAEREIVFDEFSARIGEVVIGEVQRKDGRNVFVNLGRVEVLLPPHEQIPGEPYRFNERMRVYIQDVRKTTKNPQVVVSRTHPMLVKRLFELEVPEVYEAIVEIKGVAREPGARSKVAVASRDPQVDAVGACVGHRGSRVQTIVDELRGEKVDIVRWSDNIAQYLASALSPAKVATVLAKESEQTATVIVPDDQLSLAIGRRGQNVRLAARLSGWRIDICSQTQYQEQARLAEEAAVWATIPGIRVWELARELDVPTFELLEVLGEEDIEARSHASIIGGSDAQTIRQLLAGAV
jgi:N utilization substance protein A